MANERILVVEDDPSMRRLLRSQLETLGYCVQTASDGPEAYAAIQGFLGSWVGRVLLFGWSVALFYHLCNGLRHLWWDTGRGLELRSVYASGWAVVAGTVALTLIAWIAGISHWTR